MRSLLIGIFHPHLCSPSGLSEVKGSARFDALRGRDMLSQLQVVQVNEEKRRKTKRGIRGVRDSMFWDTI
jgi:hypothetical protein